MSYSETDIDNILDALPKIQEQIRIFELNKMIPNLQEINKVNGIIHNYIKDNNKIIYGGFAQNLLIKNKNPKDGIYKELDTPDIEFYSSNPIDDVVNICNLLLKAGFENITAEEGVHHETFKIFVNFKDYCDISFIEPSIEKNIDIIIIENFKMPLPLFIYIDSWRVYSDPITSYWRIEKTFTRTNKLLKYYPLPNKTGKVNFSFKNFNEINPILDYLRDVIRNYDSLIMTGIYSYNYLFKKANLPQFLIPEIQYTLISTNYDYDVNQIFQILKNKYQNNLQVFEFYPFFMVRDRSTHFIINGHRILRIFKNNGKCITFNQSINKKLKIGSFQLLILEVLIEINEAIIKKNQNQQDNFKLILANLFSAQKEFLSNFNITIIDNSPFQEFNPQCYGEPVDINRLNRLRTKMNIKLRKPAKWRYDPETKGKIMSYHFEKTDGEIIKNEEYRTIKERSDKKIIKREKTSKIKKNKKTKQNKK